MRMTILVPITLLAIPSGCHRFQRSETVVVHADAPPTQSRLTGTQPDCLWESVQDALRRRGFTLDRVDREAGVITTLPESSQHFFEIWRRDVNTHADFWEASLNPMRRWVEVKVAPPADAGGELVVIVHKERLSTLDRQFNSTGAAYQYFGKNLPATTGEVKVTPEHDRWVDRGRDLAMEQFLLTAILEQAAIPQG